MRSGSQGLRYFAAAWLSAGALVFWWEFQRLRQLLSEVENPTVIDWLASLDPSTTPPMFLLLLAPVFLVLKEHVVDPETPLIRTGIRWLREPLTTDVKPGRWRRAMLFCVAVVGVASLTTSWTYLRVGSLPPAYHDEYSYLFQAETFSQGRVVNSGFAEAPELFDQMHVLNLEPGRFASRYFPGVAVWLLPWVWWGQAVMGQMLAFVITVGLVFVIGRELGGNGVGFFAGLILACAPGVIIFSNTLLSHMPTLLALTVFLWAMLRFIRLPHWSWALLAGTGLACAMLCRPMTAAGFGLPFGIWFLGWLVVTRNRGREVGKSVAGESPSPRPSPPQQHGKEKESSLWGRGSVGAVARRKFVCLLAMGGPLLVGLILMAVYNQQVTGDWKMTPYQQYTENYTPRHVYGFFNVSRGERWIEEAKASGRELPVVEAYDRWATELTPRGALFNVIVRLLASAQMTLDIVPFLMSIPVLLLGWRQWSVAVWLIIAGIISLHIVHLPYWFVGIHEWHYVFEACVLWALWFAMATKHFFDVMDARNRIWLKIWWAGFVVFALLVNLVSFEPFWTGRLDKLTSEMSWSRQRFAAMEELLEAQVADRPAVVLISQDPGEFQQDFVFNSPGLDAPILRARWLPDRYPAERVFELFPERTIYWLQVPTSREEFSKAVVYRLERSEGGS